MGGELGETSPHPAATANAEAAPRMDADAQAEMASTRTKLLYGSGSIAFGVNDQSFAYILSFGLYFVALICLSFYKIDRATHEANLRKLGRA